MMLQGARLIIVMLVLSIFSAGALAASESVPDYRIVKSISGPGGVFVWDYATIDARLNRLFVATLSVRPGAPGSYSGAITAFDLATGAVVPVLLQDGLPHKVTILGHGVAAAADAASHSVLFFSELTGKVLGRVFTGTPRASHGLFEPDSLVLEPRTGLLVVVNHDNGTLVLVNIARRKVVGRIAVGGVLEAAAAEGDGSLFVNVTSAAAVAVVSVPLRRVVRRLSLQRCEEPTGIAYDRKDRAIISVCSNGKLKFVNLRNGAEIASLPVGKGADGVMYDPHRNLVYIAGGDTGAFSVITVRDIHAIRTIATLRLPVGTRLGAVDPKSGRIYLPSVKYDLAAPPLQIPGFPALPRAVPDTFKILVVGSVH